MQSTLPAGSVCSTASASPCRIVSLIDFAADRWPLACYSNDSTPKLSMSWKLGPVRDQSQAVVLPPS